MKPTLFTFSLFTFSLLLLLIQTATAQWEQSNGPTGGYITHMIQDSSGILFASTGWGGIFRSIDGGDTWASAEEGLTWPGSSLVANDTAVFTSSNGIARSFDSGETWEQSNNGLDNTDVGSLTVNTQGHIYAGVIQGTNGDAGVYISIDNGESWTFKSLLGLAYMETIEVAVNDSNHIFVGGPGIVVRSTDNGDTWEDISPVNGIYYVRTIEFDSSGVIYVGGTFDGGLFRSEDNGATWTTLMTDEVFSISINSENEVFAATGTGVYMSVNGIDWVLLDDAPPVTVHCLLADNDDTLFAGCYGVYRSFDDGINWEKSSDGMVSTIVWSMDATQSGVLFAVTDSLWRSDDDGENWENVSDGFFGTDMQSKVVAGPNGVEYVVTNQGFEGRLYQSLDDGDTWQLLFAYSSSFSDVKINSQGDIFVATDYSGLWRSTDGGANFMMTGFDGVSIEAMVIGNEGTILVGTGSPSYYVYRSVDNGDTWSPSYTMFSWGGAQYFATDSVGYFYMATYDELLSSADDGVTWENLTLGLPVSFTAIGTGASDTVYVATRSDGIFRSGDWGITWEPYNEGLPAYGWVNSFATSAATGYLYAGYHGKGVWLRGDGDINIPVFYADRPVSGIKIFPNPARESATIRYDAYKPSTISTIGIHDLHGRLLKEIQLTGTETPLQLEGLSKGMYLVGLAGIGGGEKLVVE